MQPHCRSTGYPHSSAELAVFMQRTTHLRLQSLGVRSLLKFQFFGPACTQILNSVVRRVHQNARKQPVQAVCTGAASQKKL